MPRDARQWNDYRAHIKITEGDPAECHIWYGVALIRLKFLLEHRPGSVTDVMVPTEGVYIRVDTRPNRVHIKVEEGGIYLESGFLDLLSAAKCAENAYKPAVLHFNSSILAYRGLHPEFDWWQGKVIATDLLTVKGEDVSDGYESLAVGCTGKQDSVVALPPCTQVYSNGGYCDPKKIYQKKEAQANTPASMFSGKLRLWIQALYGQKQCRYSAAKGLDGRVIPGHIYIGDKEYTEDSETFVTRKLISAFYAPSYGLFTTEDYQYFLVEVSSVINYYPLKITSAAEKIRAMLNAPPPEATSEDIKRAEAYVLSTAHVDVAGMQTSGTITPLGTPLYYGFHWKWDGSSADIVTHEVDHSVQKYLARHYRVDITFNGSNFSHSLTLVESGYWWPAAITLNVFYPIVDNGEQKSTCMLPINTNEFGAIVTPPSTFGAYGPTVLHCFRDTNDILQTVKYSQNIANVSGVYSYTYNTPCLLQPGDEILFYSNGNKNGANGSNNLTIGSNQLNGSILTASNPLNTYILIGSDFSGPFKVQAFNRAEAYPLICDGSKSVASYMDSMGYWSGSTSAQPAGPGSYYAALLYYAGKTDRRESIIGNMVERDCAMFIQIPWNSCSSVVSGQQKKKITNNNSTIDYFKLNRSFYSHFSVWAYSSSNVQLYEVLPITPLKGVAGETISSAFDHRDKKSAYTAWGGELNVLAFNGAIFSADNIYSISNASVGVLGRYFDIVYFGTTPPILDGIDFVKESTSGDYKYFVSAFSGDHNFPGDISVGWA